jgi:hypothetical protein
MSHGEINMAHTRASGLMNNLTGFNMQELIINIIEIIFILILLV